MSQHEPKIIIERNSFVKFATVTYTVKGTAKIERFSTRALAEQRAQVVLATERVDVKIL